MHNINEIMEACDEKMKIAKKRNLTLSVGILILIYLLLNTVSYNPALAADSNPVANTIETKFSDVPSTDANAMYINFLNNRSIISGYPDGSFHPNEGLSRAQAATVIVKAAGLTVDPQAETMFSDVSNDHWAKAYIAAAEKTGYIKGMGDGSYHPEDTLTRAQAISLILRLSTKDMSGIKLPSSLTDIDSQNWAAPSVAVGLASGMVGLSADGKQYLPDAPLSRINLAHALGVLLTGDPGLYATTLEGTLKVRQGIIRVQTADSKNEVQIKTETTVKAGDIIKTGDKSSAELNYPDGSSILIEENTQINIVTSKGRKYLRTDGSEGTAVDFLDIKIKQGTILGGLATKQSGTEQPGTNQKTGQIIKQLGGKLIASLQNIGLIAAGENEELPWYVASEKKKVKIQVDMPWGVAGIRGTFWQNIVTPSGESSTSVLIGHADVTSDGQTVALTENQSTVVTSATAPPPQPTALPPVAVQQFMQEQNWLTQTAQIMQQVREATPPPPPVAVEIAPVALPGQITPEPPVTPITIQPTLSITQIINQAMTSITNNTPPTPASAPSPVAETTSSNHAVGQAIATEGTKLITYTLNKGTFSVAAAVYGNWTMAGANITDLGNITDIVLSPENTVATITVTNPIGAVGQIYTIAPTQAALSSGFTVPAAATVTITATVDITAPVLSLTSASAITDITATLNFTTNEAGTYYYLVYAATDSPPNAATIEAQGAAVAKGTAATLAVTKTVNVTGLTASTAYKAYVIVKDSAGNDSAVSTITITTTAPDDVVISTAAIAGVAVPMAGATPTATIADTTEYTATITWGGNSSTFTGGIIYTATITITPKTGYTLTGVAENFFTVAGAISSTNSADSGVVTAVFPATAATVVNTLALDLLVVTPVNGATPNTTAIDQPQYTGTIAWYESDGTTPVTGNFAASTVYIAKVSLTAKTGYTLTGVGANTFTYTGATVTNSADSGVVTAVFPATAATVVNTLALDLLVVTPVNGATPNTTAIDQPQYTGTIAWYESDGTTPVTGNFAASTVYIAKVSLTAKTGYTLTGVGANTFTCTSAKVINAANSGAITITFMPPGSIISIAGNGTQGFSGDGGAAANSVLNSPQGVAIDASGNIYFADSNNNRIRRIDHASGNISTVAGTGSPGSTGDNGLAINALLHAPKGVAVDGSGNIYIADTGNYRIRKVDHSTGIITAVAGTGVQGKCDGSGVAASAQFHDPIGLAVFNNDDLYISDGYYRIYKVTGSSIAIVAGTGTQGYSGDNGPATNALLKYPRGIAVDASGNLYIADKENNRIREVAAVDGKIYTVAGNGTPGYSGDGSAATSAKLNLPTGVAVDGSGNIYIVDMNNSCIREVAAVDGKIYTVAGNGTAGYLGDGSAAIGAKLNYPYDMAVDAAGSLYIADTTNNLIRKVITAVQ